MNSGGVSCSSSTRLRAPSTLGASTRSAAAAVFIWITPPPATPAAWITPSIRPNRSRARAITAASCARSATSAPSTMTSAPAASSFRTARMRAATA